MSLSLILLILLAICLLVLGIVKYLHYRELYSKFRQEGVKNLPTFPLLGSMGYMMLQIENMAENAYKPYNAFPNERFVGRFDFTDPTLVIRDLDLVKLITVKEFENFVDRRSLIDEKIDPLFGRTLFSLKGQEWKDMRLTLSPAFTSFKIKQMLPFIVEVGEQMNRSLKTRIEESGVGYIDVEVKDLSTRYAIDVIASCAFGLKVDSHGDANNIFYKKGKKTFDFRFKILLIFFGYVSIPKIMKFFNVTVFSASSRKFFQHLVNSTIQDREERNVVRPDLIHLLMEAKRSREDKLSHAKAALDANVDATVQASSARNITRVWSQDDLIAQAVVFFLAGFDTVSSTMSFLIHELALHPEIQEQLYQEIRHNEVKNEGQYDYTSIMKMEYMDMVVSETLRLWPPLATLDRVCLKDYNIGKPNPAAAKDYVVRKGDAISIPVWGFHRDPQYFPEPSKFDPERFSNKNKQKINPIAYMPFGIGPRNCIGSRLALCEVKMLVYQLLQQVEISPCEKTSTREDLQTGIFQLILKGGHWVRMKKRV